MKRKSEKSKEDNSLKALPKSGAFVFLFNIKMGLLQFVWDARFARRVEGKKEGMYLSRFKTNGISESRKLLLLK